MAGLMDEVELPTWLTTLVDQRLALVNDAVVPAALFKDQAQLILTPLSEPPEGSSQRMYDQWDRTCDACQKFCATEPFYTGAIQRTADNGSTVIMTFGVCKEHKF